MRPSLRNSLLAAAGLALLFRCGPGIVNPSRSAESSKSGSRPGVVVVTPASPTAAPDPAPAVPDPALQPPVPNATVPDKVGGGERISRLTPEQMSKSLSVSLDVGVGYFLDGVLVGDYLLYDYAIPLGGLDLPSYVRKRDRLTKPQTLLITRQVAWIAAVNIITKENEIPPPVKTLFTKCNYLVDHPALDDAAAARWRDQLQDFYLRLFSRPATEAEVALVTKTFTTTYAREGKTSSAWLVTLFSLISTMEAWNAWR